jgi:hypothetical protein
MKPDKCLMECRFESNNPKLNLRLLLLVALSLPESIHTNLIRAFAGSDSGVYLTFPNNFHILELDNWIRRGHASVGQYLKSDQKVSFVYRGESQPAEAVFPNGDRHELYTLCEP